MFAGSNRFCTSKGATPPALEMNKKRIQPRFIFRLSLNLNGSCDAFPLFILSLAVSVQ